MLGGIDRQLRVPSLFFIVDDRLVFLLQDPTLDLAVEFNRPVIRGIFKDHHAQVMHDIPASDDQHTFPPQALKLFPQVIMRLGIFIDIQAQ